MRQHEDGTTTFSRANGAILEAAPPLPVSIARLDATSCGLDEIPVWDGTPFNAALAIDVLYTASGRRPANRS